MHSAAILARVVRLLCSAVHHTFHARRVCTRAASAAARQSCAAWISSAQSEADGCLGGEGAGLGAGDGADDVAPPLPLDDDVATRVGVASSLGTSASDFGCSGACLTARDVEHAARAYELAAPSDGAIAHDAKSAAAANARCSPPAVPRGPMRECFRTSEVA
jgi:hypothetical protein